VQAKDLAQHIVDERRPVSRLDILRLLAIDGIPFSQRGRDFGPRLAAPLVRPPIARQQCSGHGYEHGEGDRDGSGQHSRDRR
jgi:hypothetical protein